MKFPTGGDSPRVGEKPIDPVKIRDRQYSLDERRFLLQGIGLRLKRFRRIFMPVNSAVLNELDLIDFELNYQLSIFNHQLSFGGILWIKQLKLQAATSKDPETE